MTNPTFHSIGRPGIDLQLAEEADAAADPVLQAATGGISRAGAKAVQALHQLLQDAPEASDPMICSGPRGTLFCSWESLPGLGEILLALGNEGQILRALQVSPEPEEAVQPIGNGEVFSAIRTWRPGTGPEAKQAALHALQNEDLAEAIRAEEFALAEKDNIQRRITPQAIQTLGQWATGKPESTFIQTRNTGQGGIHCRWDEAHHVEIGPDGEILEDGFQ